MSDDAPIGPCSPFFIVEDMPRALAHYVDRLGFDLRYKSPENNPWFAIVGRGSAQIFLKDVGVEALPNNRRHGDARWDAFIYVADPDALASELGEAAQDTGDGLRGFELTDPDGYVCFFGRPR